MVGLSGFATDVPCSTPRHVEQQYQRRSDDNCWPESIRYFVHSRFLTIPDECRFSMVPLALGIDSDDCRSVPSMKLKFCPFLVVPAVRNRSQREAGSGFAFSRLIAPWVAGATPEPRFPNGRIRN
jgi:hypothetical protein